MGSVLRVVFDQSIKKYGIQLLKVSIGEWMKFVNVHIEVRAGIWRGVLTPLTKVRYTPNKDRIVYERQRLLMLWTEMLIEDLCRLIVPHFCSKCFMQLLFQHFWEAVAIEKWADSILELSLDVTHYRFQIVCFLIYLYPLCFSYVIYKFSSQCYGSSLWSWYMDISSSLRDRLQRCAFSYINGRPYLSRGILFSLLFGNYLVFFLLLMFVHVRTLTTFKFIYLFHREFAR